MRIIRCPKCGAALQIADDAKSVECPRCGRTISTSKRY